MAAWIAYVPFHELLHAFGCMATGGDVRELQIQPLYGGLLLAKVLPFVRSGGEYAGRLTQFDTRGSDLTYLATDLAPFLLTLLGAFPLLAMARRRKSAVILGAGLVLASAPLVSLTGDLYEMGSIVVTAGVGALPVWGAVGDPEAIRSDDLLALLGQFAERLTEDRTLWASIIIASFVVGWMIGNAILLAAWRLNERIVKTRAGVPRVA